MRRRQAALSTWSLSARRAWIEISRWLLTSNACDVALRKESVDRNLPGNIYLVTLRVALRKESVDRNSELWASVKLAITVALRKESVDRNDFAQKRFHQRGASLSARRAWIEIFCVRSAALRALVALRKESVDRNWMRRRQAALSTWSLSARRAWIEIC